MFSQLFFCSDALARQFSAPLVHEHAPGKQGETGTCVVTPNACYGGYSVCPRTPYLSPNSLPELLNLQSVSPVWSRNSVGHVIPSGSRSRWGEQLNLLQ